MKHKKKLFVLMILVISMLSMAVSQVGASRGDSATIGDISEAIAISDMGTVVTVTYYSYCENMIPQPVRSVYNATDDVADMIQPFFLSMCGLFGHIWGPGAKITTIHRAYTTVPRCREIWNSIDMCTRSNCSVYVVLTESIRRVGCC